MIAALEQAWPDPHLYPEDPGERRRALELEDYFDEELGPHMRLLGFHEIVKDRERLETLIERTAPPPLAKSAGAAARYVRAFTGVRYGVLDDRAAEESGGKVLAALDPLEQELGDRDYLVGDSFTVADLTAAALFNPLVLPEGGPIPHRRAPARGPAELPGAA